MAKGTPPVDASSLAPGVSRTEVEARLGQSKRNWTTAEGVRYSLYEFGPGVPPQPADAIMMAMFSLYTLGLVEVIHAANPPPPASEGDDFQVVVSYDANDVVLGLFDEHETLPIDGRSDRRPKAFCWNRNPDACRYE
jgi:hypothetical protein